MFECTRDKSHLWLIGLMVVVLCAIGIIINYLAPTSSSLVTINNGVPATPSDSATHQLLIEQHFRGILSAIQVDNTQIQQEQDAISQFDDKYWTPEWTWSTDVQTTSQQLLYNLNTTLQGRQALVDEYNRDMLDPAWQNNDATLPHQLNNDGSTKEV